MSWTYFSGKWCAPCIAQTQSLIYTDLFLALVTASTEIGNSRPSAESPELVARIHEVSFYSLSSGAWDDAASATGDISSSPDYADMPAASSQIFEHPCMPLTKIMSSGSFYYATDSHWDLSSRLSHRLSRDASDAATYDERFVWNEYIVRSLLEFRERLSQSERDELDLCHFIVRQPDHFNAIHLIL